MFIRIAAAAFALSSLSAQEPQPEAVFKVDTTVRQIDAVVVDNQGRLVTGLNASDFQVLEGRKARPVEYCSFIPLADGGGTASPDGRLTAERLQRTFIFVVSSPRLTVDLEGSRGADLNSKLLAAAARGSADSASLLEHFVRNRMQPGDLAMILKVDRDTGVLAQLTNDHSALLSAIDKMRKDPLTSGAGRIEVRFNLRARGARRTLSMRPDFQDLLEQNLRVLRLASAAVGQIEPLPGRKAIVMAAHSMLPDTPNFPEGEVVGRAIRDLAARANAAGVTIHAISLAGLKPWRSAGPDGPESLSKISDATGGITVQDSNDFTGALDRILELNRGYYLLGYRVAEPNARPAPVKVKLARPGLQIYARNAGIAPGVLARDRQLSTEEATAQAFASPLSLQDLAVGLEVNPVEPLPRAGKTRLHYDLKIDLGNVQLGMQETGKQGFSLEMTLGVAGPDGAYITFESNVHHYHIAEGEEQTFAKQLARSYDVDVEKPGDYQVRVLVRDVRSNRAGSATRFVHVERAGGKELNSRR